jgi:hypothetical protein
LKKVYAWRRFWARDGLELSLEDKAYLPDPDDLGRFLNPGVESFQKVGDEVCAFLLGD